MSTLKKNFGKIKTMEVESIKKISFYKSHIRRSHFSRGFWKKIIDFVREQPDRQYNLIVGSDSFPGEQTVFVTAIIIHRKGAGGRYFYRRIKYEKKWIT